MLLILEKSLIIYHYIGGGDIQGINIPGNIDLTNIISGDDSLMYRRAIHFNSGSLSVYSVEAIPKIHHNSSLFNILMSVLTSMEITYIILSNKIGMLSDFSNIPFTSRILTYSDAPSIIESSYKQVIPRNQIKLDFQDSYFGSDELLILK